VKFQLNDLCDAMSDNQWRQTLQNLPKNLGETYARLLNKIRASSTRFDMAQRMFTWILCARRPMLIEELREAVSLDTTDSHLDHSKIPSVEDGRLMQCCGNLAVLNRNDSTIRLAHHTVRQFLLGDSTWQIPSMTHLDISAMPLPPTTIESHIGELCVTYLCFADFERQITKRDRATMGMGTDILQSAVYSQRPVASVIGKLARTVRSGWTETEIPRRPLSIDLGTFRTRQGAFHQSFALLNYIMQHWTSHAASLTTASTTWKKFKSVVFDRQYLFDVKPWESEIYRIGKGKAPNDPLVRDLQLFRWVIDEGLPTFLELIPSEDNTESRSLSKHASFEETSDIHPLIRAARADQVASFRFLCRQIYNSAPSRPSIGGFLDIYCFSSPCMLAEFRTHFELVPGIFKNFIPDLLLAFQVGDMRAIKAMRALCEAAGFATDSVIEPGWFERAKSKRKVEAGLQSISVEVAEWMLDPDNERCIQRRFMGL
jgi:hypothetical protein